MLLRCLLEIVNTYTRTITNREIYQKPSWIRSPCLLQYTIRRRQSSCCCWYIAWSSSRLLVSVWLVHSSMDLHCWEQC